MLVLLLALGSACLPPVDAVDDVLDVFTHIRVAAHLIELDEPTQARVDREAAELETLYALDSGPALWTEPWQLPVRGVVTDRFGTQRTINGVAVPPHNGVDQRAKAGTPIGAAASGRVVYVGRQYIRGNVVVIDHGAGVYSTYAHMQSVDVDVGDVVATGARIGEVGKTGRVTGPHLHWEVHMDGTAVDPLEIVKACQR